MQLHFRSMSRLAAAAALFAVACGDSVGPKDATRYYLVELQGQTLPIHTETRGIDGEGNPLTPVCDETLYSQYIELRAPATAVRVSDRLRGCDGETPKRETITQNGSYTVSGDSIDVTIDSGEWFGSFTTRFVKEGDRLVWRQKVYSEADPDGSDTLYTVAVYEAK